MYEEGLKGLVKISQAIGNSADYVQGGGGNTSAKLGNGFMAIKASGYLISQITEEVGFVAVNYETILDYYRNGDHSREVDYDKESQELAVGSIKQIKSEPSRRPSVEVGFHSALKKYVLHSHSVYSNVLLCSKTGNEKIKELMDTTNYDYTIMTFINPGYPLSLKMTQLLDSRKNAGLNTDVIFLENHGLIVTSDDADTCIEVNKQINELIKNSLSLESFPKPTVKEITDGVFASSTNWLIEVIAQYNDMAEMLVNMPLYPDQLVYMSGISFEDDNSKILINPKTGEIKYRGTLSETQAIEETIAGVAYVLKSIIDKGMEIKPMPEEGIRYILGWESEKYRRNMVSK